MSYKTDDDSEVGLHPFEASGLGKAPFRFVGAAEKRGPIKLADGVTEIGAPGQPMGTCDYCGQGIAICCTIQDADGKTFEVGSDCVRKTSDDRLIEKFKTHPDIREINRERRHKLAMKKRDYLEELIEKHERKLAEISHPHGRKDETLLDCAKWYLLNAGDKGRRQMIKWIESKV